MLKHVGALKRDLEKILLGDVVANDAPEYRDAIEVYNAGIRHTPALVIRPQGSADLRALLKYSSTNDVRITTRSGGHSSNGYSLNSDGVVVDMRSINGIATEGSALKVGGGATWNDVYNHISAEGGNNFVIGATWPGVGVSGFILGGGYSFISRSHGLACDNIRSCKVVTTQGEEIEEIEVGEQSSASLERQLLWGLKGAGGGNFGIVSEFKIKQYISENPLVTGHITFAFDRIDEVIEAYDDWAAKLPDTVSVYGTIMSEPSLTDLETNQLVVRFSFASAESHSETLEILSPLLGLKANDVRIFSMSLADWARHLGGADAGGQFGAYTRSAMLRRGSFKKLLPILKANVSLVPQNAVFIVWTHAGGKISTIDPSLTSFQHRSIDYVLALRVFWPKKKPELLRPLITWGYRFFEEIEPFSNGAYVNYIDPLLGGWRDKYYKGCYHELLKIKEMFDPKGTLLFQQGIGSEFEPTKNNGGRLDLDPLFRTFEAQRAGG